MCFVSAARDLVAILFRDEPHMDINLIFKGERITISTISLGEASLIKRIVKHQASSIKHQVPSISKILVASIKKEISGSM